MLSGAGAGPSDSEIRNALFNDLVVNAMIGNGNDEADWDWYLGPDHRNPPRIEISDLRCRPLFHQRVCRLLLSRTPNPASQEPEAETAQAPRLRCSATLQRERQNDGRRVWKVLHFPPDERWGGHSRTSMHCRVARAR